VVDTTVFALTVMAKNNAAKEEEAKRGEAKKIIFILGRHSFFF
jgi:hypothetical protein